MKVYGVFKKNKFLWEAGLALNKTQAKENALKVGNVRWTWQNYREDFETLKKGGYNIKPLWIVRNKP